jgi:hypothetical protein
MPSLSLADIRLLAAKAADVVVADGTRHTPAIVNAWVNTALGTYHAVLTDAGGEPQRATRTTLTTSASETVANGYPTNERVVLPADFDELREVSVVFGTARRPIRPFGGIDSSLGSEEYWSTESLQPGLPERYAIARNAEGETVLRLLPPCDAVYTIEIHYIPTFTDLDDDADTFPFLDGTSDMVTCDVALRLLEADGVQEGGQYQAITRRRDMAEQRLRLKARRMNRAGPRAMIDVRLRTRRARGGFLA